MKRNAVALAPWFKSANTTCRIDAKSKIHNCKTDNHLERAIQFRLLDLNLVTKDFVVANSFNMYLIFPACTHNTPFI